jgi:hypothetical protein
MKVSRPTKPGGTSPTSKRVMGNQPGGGIGGRSVSPQGVRNGAPAYGVGPGWVSQLGSQIGNHSTEQGRNLPYQGEAMRNKLTPAGGGQVLGNQKALDVKGGGVGTGRTLYGQCGSQGQYGSPAGTTKPEGRDILSSFGPDSSNARNRR